MIFYCFLVNVSIGEFYKPFSFQANIDLNLAEHDALRFSPA